MGERKLKKTLSFWDILLFAVGSIVGAGIYAIIGKAAELGGNMLWLSFVIASLVALLTGLSYAEFVSRFPDAGGSFEYIKHSYGLKTATIMSIFMSFTGFVAAAAIAISFAEYFSRLLETPNWILAIGIIALMAFFNIIGSQYSSYYNMVATVITLLGLILVMGFSFEDIGKVNLWEIGELVFQGIVAGSALIFFSYIGFEDLVKMAEETKDASKNLPRAILISGVVVLVIYVLIAICCVSVLGADELSASEGPLAAVMETTAGTWGATTLVVIALFATSKTILSNILGTSRLLYDVARDSEISWLKKFTTISGIGHAPNYAIIAISLLAVAFALIGDLRVVASISNIFIFIVFGMVNFGLLRYRYLHRGEEEKAPFRVPLNVNNISVLTVLALITILVLFGYNLYNIFSGFN
jgi:amino acid transporter